MSEHHVHLLDLPNEILFLILRKLDNVHVLHSFLGIENQRLDLIAQDQIFTNTLNFSSQVTNEFCSILDRFCISILPRIHRDVKSLAVESGSLECILRAGNYPNLTEITICNFDQEIFSRYFTDDFLFGHSFKQQITDLTLIVSEQNCEMTIREHPGRVYGTILALFENLKHLTIALSSITNDPPLSLPDLPSMDTNDSRLSLYNVPSTIFSSSTLKKLCINVYEFNDLLALLDGRLKQLIIFIVQVGVISDYVSSSHNRDDLPNLKCFSITSYNGTREYDNLIIPLLRRMPHLEELTLNIRIYGRSTFIADTHLNNAILIHMPRLHTFTFYIAVENVIVNPAIRLSNFDLQRTFTNVENKPVACMVDYFEPMKMICRVFSLPFRFHRLKDITNNIPNIIFNSVSHLELWDKHPFKYEFFLRLARAFPFLQNLSVSNLQPPFRRFNEYHLLEKDWCSMIEYPHLVSLNLEKASTHYVNNFLDQAKIRLPRLTELKVEFDDLKMVTKNFTRDETFWNCAKVKRLILPDVKVYPKKVCRYFPSLSV